MLKRLLNMAFLLLIPIGLVALVTAFSGNNTALATRSASVANNPGYVPSGVWSNLPALPTVTLGFGSGQYGSEGSTALKLKRASAVAYPPNGKVYILGGRHRADGDDISSPWIWQYDPVAGTYTRKTSLIDADITGNGQCSIGCYGTRASGNMAVATLSDGTNTRIYMIGGSDSNSTASNRVRVYDPVADSLTYMTTDVWPAAPARIPGGYAVYNNKLYIFGGYDPSYNNVVYSDTWVFDPTAAAGSRWSHITSANLSVARGFIGGAEVDGYIYAVGGDVTTGIISTTVVPQTIVERMHPGDANPTWLPVASLPTARGDMGVWSYDSGTGYEISGKVVVGGGNFPLPDSNAYIYDPGTNSWSTFPSLLRNRRNVAYTQYNGILYAFGGYNVGTSYDGANDSMSYDASAGGATFTPAPTNTSTNTAVPTNTNTAVPSNTAVSTNTNTPVPTNTNTAVPTNTNTSIPTNTNTSIPTNTHTAVPTGTNTTVPTNTSTHTLVPTNTPVSTNTGIPATNTAVPPTDTQVPATDTSVPGTDTPTSTDVPATDTAVPPTATTCSIDFTDVPVGSTFYPYIHCLACFGIINGYSDGTFQPESPVTRGQIAKITANAAGWNDEPTGQTFEDVPTDSTFYLYIERMYAHNVMQGYTCGGPLEPCGSGNLPYFRTYSNATRGQISKIISESAAFNDIPGAQQYVDVPVGSTFFTYIYRLTVHSVITGYACGGAGEPCNSGNMPYFRPLADATRGQAAKLISIGLFTNCAALGR